MSINVKKRNTKSEPYMVSKIKQVISWACERTEVNPLELESKFDDFITDGISTTHIHDNLIYHAQSLATAASPDWVIVAGRLQTMKLWKETCAYDMEFYDYIQLMKTKGHYSHPAIDSYSKEEIDELGKEIKQDRDLLHSYGSVITAMKKYLSPGECIQQMFMVNSMIMAYVEQKETRIDVIKKFYEKLSSRKISLATPWLSNLRDNGNISSCFIIAVDDSIDSITNNWRNAAFISKLGGGLGIDLSRIRAKGATIGKVKQASGGVCGWAKTFNEIAVNVDQCFHEDTLIETVTGPKHIKDIVVKSDLVLTHDGTFSTVEKLLSNRSKKLVSRKITTSAGEVIVTESHPVLVVNGNINDKTDLEILHSLKTNNDLHWKWKNVADLEVNDKIITVIHQPTTRVASTTNNEVNIKVPTFDEVNDINSEILRFNFDSLSLNTVMAVTEAVKTSTKVYDLLMADSNKSYVVTELGVVHNGGKRAGAFTVSLPIWHRDIEDFLEIQSETGDQRKKAHDIFPQIAIHDLYMEAIKANGDWYTFCPHEVKVVLGFDLYGCSSEVFEDRYNQSLAAYKAKKLTNVGKYNAKDFMKRIMRTQFETGLPYLFFVDTANKTNPNKHEGHIPCGNLCQESFSNVVPDKYAHTCNLASLVVGRMESIDEVIETARIATRMLDNGIYLTASPVTISESHNNRYRTIGVGIQGLHDYLALNYTNYSDLNSIAKLAEAIEYGCVVESIELSKERGSYPAFEGSMWQTGERVESFKQNSVNNFNWDKVQQDINAYGIRNSQLTSPAPNCQAADNPVLVYDGTQSIVSSTLYDVLDSYDIDTARIEEEGIPMWINLDSPIAVPTYEGKSFVHRIWYNGLSEQVFSFTFSDGSTYEYTGNHKLLISNDHDAEEWVECKDIEVGSRLLSRNLNAYVSIDDKQIKTSVHTYDFEVKNMHHYLMSNGIVSHNTSTSIFMDAAAGVMPVYSAFFREDNSTGKFPVASMHLTMNPLCYSKTFGKHDQVKLTEAVGKLQQFIDTGISAEYLFDQNVPNFTAKMLFDTIMAAWENKTKSVYYIRSIKRGSTIDELLGIKDDGCVSCAG